MFLVLEFSGKKNDPVGFGNGQFAPPLTRLHDELSRNGEAVRIHGMRGKKHFLLRHPKRMEIGCVR